MNSQNKAMLVNKKLLAILLLTCAVAACDDDTPPTSPTPAPPVTETFTGTLSPNGAATHSFNTSASGTITATLKAVGTDDSLEVSFGLGNWFADACSIVYVNDKAKPGFVLSRQMTGAGTLCARIGDVGNLPTGRTVEYTIEVEHP